MDPIAASEIVKTLSLLGAAIAIGFGGIGAGIGVGMAGGFAVEGMGRQQKVKSELFRTMLIGQAAASTPPTFALVVSILLLFTNVEGAPLVQGFAALGAGISIGAAALASGVGSSFPVALACQAIARQPRMRRPYMTLMLLGQAVSQTPVIFALMISFMLIFLPGKADAGMVEFVTVLSAGICMGFGAIGASIGSGFAAESAIIGVRHHREPENATGVITRTMLLGLAVAQSPCVFALVVSFILILTG